MTWKPREEDLGLGVEQLFVGEIYCGWVSRCQILGMWLCNWVTTWPDRAPWPDPRAGDSIGHLYPTVEQAKAAVEQRVWAVIVVSYRRRHLRRLDGSTRPVVY